MPHTPEQQAAYNQARRERYASDPAYREERKAAAAATRASLRDDPTRRDEANQARRDRYANDPAYAEKQRQNARRQRKKRCKTPED